MSLFFQLEDFDYSSLENLLGGLNMFVGGYSLLDIVGCFRVQDMVLRNFGYSFPFRLEYSPHDRYGLIFYSELQNLSDEGRDDADCFIFWDDVGGLWQLCFSVFGDEDVDVVYSGGLEQVVLLLSDCCVNGVDVVFKRCCSFGESDEVECD